MNREIKFRVWEVVSQRYTVSHVIDGDGKIFLKPSMGEDDLCLVSPDSVIVEQFTGLKDKKGRDIYEGDIVTTIPSGGCLSSLLSPEDFVAYTRGEIQWWCGSWKVCQPHLGATRLYDFTDCECCPAHSVEVIGNIHESPILLNPSTT